MSGGVTNDAVSRRARQATMFAAKFAAETISQEPPRYVEPTDAALANAFAWCVRPPTPDLYDDIRTAFFAEFVGPEVTSLHRTRGAA